MSHSEIPGGVTAAQGFQAGSIYCGVKEANKNSPDIALIVSNAKTAAAAFTFDTMSAMSGEFLFVALMPQ